MVKRSLVVLLCASCALAACPVALSGLGELEFACRLDDECAQGARCVDGRCQTPARVMDAASLDAELPDTAQIDAGLFDQAPHDVAQVERLSLDARSADSVSPDRFITDTSTSDAASPDAASPDAASHDTASPDAASPDAASPDAASPDAASPDAASLDVASADVASADVASADAGSTDVASPDAAFLDAASPDADSPDAFAVLCNLQAGDWSFTSPMPVTELNTDSSERDPVLSTDGLTIYFSSNRPDGMGSSDLWTATRPDRDSPFSVPVNVGAFNSDRSDARISFTVDELQVFVSTSREGGPGETDIWGARRASVEDAFGALAPIDNVNSEVSDHDPFVSVNGLRLYFATYGFTGATGGQDVVVAERASADEPFGAPVGIAEVNSPLGDADPALTFDERIMLLASRRHSDDTEADIYYATRAQVTDPFSTPQQMPVVNSDASDGDPFISGDGCEIFFFSNRSGNNDVWRARYQAAP